MHDSKLFRLLKTLETKELKQLRKYLESPYFNVNKTMVLMFGCYEVEIMGKANSHFKPELLWEFLFPNQPFDYDRLRKLQHNLLMLVLDFIAQMSYDNNSAAKSHYLLQHLAEKQLEDQIMSVIQSGITVINKSINRNAEYYYNLYSIEKYKYLLANLEFQRVQKSNIEKLNLVDIDRHLNLFFIIEKLRNYNLVLSWSKMIPMETNLPLINETIELIEYSKHLDSPVVMIYYHIYLTFTEPENTDHFYSLKNLIDKHLYLFPHAEARDIMNAAINYTIQQQNKGNQNFTQANFELWNQSLQSGLALVNNEISPWAFKNIVTLALRLKKYDWVENFIANYSQKINQLYRENAVNYNLASLYFYKKRYDKAIPLLQQVEFDELNYGLGAKSILLACFYELDEYDPLLNHLESLKVFIKRNKTLTSPRKKSYLELVSFTKKLIEVRNNRGAILSLKQMITESQAMSKQWLLEKVEELIA